MLWTGSLWPALGQCWRLISAQVWKFLGKKPLAAGSRFFCSVFLWHVGGWSSLDAARKRLAAGGRESDPGRAGSHERSGLSSNSALARRLKTAHGGRIVRQAWPKESLVSAEADFRTTLLVFPMLAARSLKLPISCTPWLHIECSVKPRSCCDCSSRSMPNPVLPLGPCALRKCMYARETVVPLAELKQSD